MAATFLREGWKVAYAADAQVLHSHNLAPVEQYRRNPRGRRRPRAQRGPAPRSLLNRGGSEARQGGGFAAPARGRIGRARSFRHRLLREAAGGSCGTQKREAPSGGRSCAKRAPIDSAARQLESEGESL